MEKSTEFRNREELLLRLGRKLLVDHGFMGLQIESIASQTSSSRATVYKHFRTKEEFASKIVLDSARSRFAAIEKAHSFDGTTRERLLALLMAEEQFATQHPDQYPSELIVRVSGVLAATAPDTQASLNELDLGIRSLFSSLIEQALRQGDLPTGCSAIELLDGIMAMCLGIQLWNWLGTNQRPSKVYALSPTSIQRLLDGYQWQPLTAAWPYEECGHRIRAFLNN